MKKTNYLVKIFLTADNTKNEHIDITYESTPEDLMIYIDDIIQNGLKVNTLELPCINNKTMLENKNIIENINALVIYPPSSVKQIEVETIPGSTDIFKYKYKDNIKNMLFYYNTKNGVNNAT